MEKTCEGSYSMSPAVQHCLFQYVFLCFVPLKYRKHSHLRWQWQRQCSAFYLSLKNNTHIWGKKKKKEYFKSSLWIKKDFLLQSILPLILSSQADFSLENKIVNAGFSVDGILLCLFIYLFEWCIRMVISISALFLFHWSLPRDFWMLLPFGMRPGMQNTLPTTSNYVCVLVPQSNISLATMFWRSHCNRHSGP